MTTVCAFDRDLTVDVNPHPDRDVVPLPWITALDDRDDVDVWAIGNQRLRHEAGIPGVPELERELGTGYPRFAFLAGILWFEWHLHRYPGLRTFFERMAPRVAATSMPPRVDRLRKLERLYRPEATFVVVDDVDLSDVDGWTHYYPWDFVERVETGALDLGIEPTATPSA